MLTRLEIINDMLAATGTAALAEASTSHPLYKKADLKLEKINRLLQGPGYWFNKATRTLQPDVNGEVILPSNILSADPVDTTITVVVRGYRLYDADNATFALNKAVEVDIVENVAITDLPPTAQALLQAWAVYAFYLDEDGSGQKLTEYRGAVADARVTFRGENLKHQDVNFFRSRSFAGWARPGARRLP